MATAMTTLTLTLPTELAGVLRASVASGRYGDEAAVIEEALRLLDHRDRLEWMRARVAEGLEDIERGDVVPYTPELMDQLLRGAEEDVRNGVALDDDDAW